MVSGGSFASSSDPRLHFGLGTATPIQSVEVHWPNGPVEQIKLPRVDAIYTVVEGSGTGKAWAPDAAEKLRTAAVVVTKKAAGATR